ncbi:MAG: diacylglycerol kinase [Pseudomonadota bacterium]
MGYVSRELRRVLTRCINTYQGLRITWREEASFAQWVVINVISIIACFLVEMSSTERLILIILGLLILVVELLNTGIEAAIDRISEDIHPLSKKAKDAGCAAVALMAAIGGFAWVYILVT